MTSNTQAPEIDLKPIVGRTVFFLAIFAALLFIPAGTLAWPGAWVFFILLATVSVAGMTWLARHDPALLRERLRPPIQKGQKPWDRALMLTFLPLWFGWYALMGFDKRFGWSDVPAPLQVVGFILLLLAVYVSWLTMRANSFAAPVIKVQKERGHKVISTGPYAYVRHPMYASVLLYGAGAPLLLGSWWGLAVAPVLIAALGVRAVFEERMLIDELPGYADYTKRVRSRFVPGVW